MSGFLDFLGNILPITGNSLIDTALFFVIGGVSFAIAWKAGELFKGNSAIMSLVHWVVRVVGFLLLWAFFVGVYWLIRLLISIPWWVWIIIGTHIAGLIVFLCVRKRIKNSNRKEIDLKQ